MRSAGCRASASMPSASADMSRSPAARSRSRSERSTAAAETGHLVLSTLHTLDASETINRIIDFFPPHLQQQARVMLASTLRGAVSQRLVPRVDGNGRVAVCEVMVVTGRVQDLILNPQ